MINKFLFIWAVCAATSMLIYGFSGVGFWSPLQSGDAVRFIILFAFHFGGPFAYGVSRMP